MMQTNSRKNFCLWAVVISLLLLSGCTTLRPKDKLVLEPVLYEQLQGWEADHHARALKAFLRSCQALEKKSDASLRAMPQLGGTPKSWRYVCRQAQETTPSSAKVFFETYFSPFRIQNKQNPKGLFTGYYESVLQGSRKRQGEYIYPLYRRPADIVPNQPYYSRKEIDRGALSGKQLELIWLRDPVEAFFLHIQGSGLVTLTDGTKIRVGYEGKNNHPYVALGKCMIERGLLTKETVSAQTIKAWLRSHPQEAQALMQENPSYVFFRKVESTGAIGAQGIPLTPYRSLAVDHRFIPYGVPLWLDVPLTGSTIYPNKPFQHLMIAQDTGGAIRGPVRGDIFFGRGKKAEHYAGTQNAVGSYVALLPKE